MFGAYFYGFVEKEDMEMFKKMSTLASQFDMNDFFFSNSPYSMSYKNPPRLFSRVLEHLPSDTEETNEDDKTSEEEGSDQDQQVLHEPERNVGEAIATQSPVATPAVESEDDEDIEENPEFEVQPTQTHDQERDSHDQSKSDEQEVDESGDDKGSEDSDSEQRPAELRRKERQDVFTADASEAMNVVLQEKPIDIIEVSSDSEVKLLEDDSDDEVSKNSEYKPIVASDGKVIKIEKDWWRLDMERKQRRQARKAEREAAQEALTAALAESRAANQRYSDEQEKSNKEFSEMKSQLAMLFQVLNSKSPGGSASLQMSPASIPSQAPAPTSSPLHSQEVQQLVPQQPSPGVNNKSDFVVKGVDTGVLTASTELPGASLEARRESRQSVVQFKVAQTINSESYRRLNDNSQANSAAATASALPPPKTGAASPLPYEEEPVDYGEGEEDMYDKMSIGGEEQGSVEANNQTVAGQSQVIDGPL